MPGESCVGRPVVLTHCTSTDFARNSIMIELFLQAHFQWTRTGFSAFTIIGVGDQLEQRRAVTASGGFAPVRFQAHVKKDAANKTMEIKWNPIETFVDSYSEPQGYHGSNDRRATNLNSD